MKRKDKIFSFKAQFLSTSSTKIFSVHIYSIKSQFIVNFNDRLYYHLLDTLYKHICVYIYILFIFRLYSREEGLGLRISNSHQLPYFFLEHRSYYTWILHYLLSYKKSTQKKVERARGILEIILFQWPSFLGRSQGY